MSAKSKERLNDSQFRELMPHLAHHEQFLTEISINGGWMRLFDVQLKKPPSQELACNMCNEKNIDFLAHIGSEKHNDLLLKVEQFFHPVYTYAKTSTNIAMGEQVSQAELDAAIAIADDALTETDLDDLAAYKSFAKRFRNRFSYLAEATLPLMELVEVEFSVRKNAWRKLLRTENPHPNGSYLCNLCSIRCQGIITVNAHFSGSAHWRLIQSECLGVRLKERKNINKYCNLRYGEKYSFKILREKEWKEKLIHLSKNNGTEKQDVTGEEQDKNIECTDGQNINDDRKRLSQTVADKAKVLSYNWYNHKKRHNVGNSDGDIDVKVEGLIGVEYVAKIENSDIYMCCLCDFIKQTDIQMQAHLIGYGHRLKYCELHYSDTLTKYKDQMGHTKYSIYTRVMEYTLHRLAKAIEEHHGRSLPCEIDEESFNRRGKRIYLADVEMYSKHATQQHGPSFSNVITTNELIEVKNLKIMYKTPDVVAGDCLRFLTPSEKQYLNLKIAQPKKLKLRSRSRSPRNLTRTSRTSPNRHTSSRSTARHSSFNKYEKPSNEITRSRSPRWQFPDRTKHRLAPESIWKHFREEANRAATDIEDMFMKFRQNPENHPLYDQEWNAYWKRRKEDLIVQGIDHRNYNFQPEWVKYFKQRIEDLYEEAIHNSEMEIRNRLNIPLDAKEDDNAKRAHRIEQQDLAISYKKPKIEAYISDTIDTNCNAQWDLQPPAVVELPKQPNLTEMFSDKANVIHVLRLLTALEDHLGSLGTKIMDLLSKALVLEKTLDTPRELEEQILTPGNCNLLETAVEKLKGILFAGLLEKNKVQGFNRVISFTSALLSYADKMGWKNKPATDMSYGQKPDRSRELQSLLEVLKKNTSAEPLKAQKSLSDTLMELISSQKTDTNTESTHRSTSIKPQALSKYSPGNSNYSKESIESYSPVRNPIVPAGPNANTNFMYSEARPKIPSNPMRMNPMGLANFSTNLRDMQQNNLNNQSLAVGRNNYEPDSNGNGRNNYNNQYNFNNMSSSRQGYGGEDNSNIDNKNKSNRNNMANYRAQDNYSQLPNMAGIPNMNKNFINNNNGSGGGNNNNNAYRNPQNCNFGGTNRGNRFPDVGRR